MAQYKLTAGRKIPKLTDIPRTYFVVRNVRPDDSQYDGSAMAIWLLVPIVIGGLCGAVVQIIMWIVIADCVSYALGIPASRSLQPTLLLPASRTVYYILGPHSHTIPM